MAGSPRTLPGGRGRFPGMSWKCPACETQILNRRLPKCVHCGEAIPSEMVLSQKQIKALDDEAERARKAGRAFAKRMRDTSSGGN